MYVMPPVAKKWGQGWLACHLQSLVCQATNRRKNHIFYEAIANYDYSPKVLLKVQTGLFQKLIDLYKR
jgi:hypothetical protein